MDFSLPEELTMVRDTVREFVENELIPIEQEVLVREKGGLRHALIPREKRERLKRLAVEQGLWAMSVPETLGGGGLNALGECLVSEELGKSFVKFDFGDVPPFLFEASAEQQDKYLKPLVAGEMECALAVRDSGEEEFRARMMPDGKSWLLNGKKFAEEADLFLLFTRTEPGLTCFLFDAGREGVSQRDGEVSLHDVSIDAADILGEIGGALALGRKYFESRRVRAAARKVGIATRLSEMSSQYARDWKALGQPLSVRPAVRRYLADMAIDVDAARWLVYRAAWLIDEGKPAANEAISSSLFASEMVERTIDRAIQTYGGPGFAPDLPVFRNYKADDATGEAAKMLDLQRFQVAGVLAES